MEFFFIRFVILCLSIYLIGKITRLYDIVDFSTVVVTAFLLALINAFVRPVLILLTLPFTLLTFGIFLFFLNGFCLLIVSRIYPLFKIKGCLTASIAALLISLINVLLESIIM